MVLLLLLLFVRPLAVTHSLSLSFSLFVVVCVTHNMRVASLVSCLVVVLLAVVGDTASPTYTLRTTDQILGGSHSQQGNIVAMSGNGLVSLSLSGFGFDPPVLAVAASPGAMTTQTMLNVVPLPCQHWSALQVALSLDGATGGLTCTDATGTNYVVFLSLLTPSIEQLLTFSNSLYSALSADGSVLAISDDSGHVVVYKMAAMGGYSLVQTITTGFVVAAIAMAPDASALAVSDQNLQTVIYGWDSGAGQFVAAPMMPLSVGCYALAASSQSAAGATTITCALDNAPGGSVYSLLNVMGTLSLTLQSTIGSSYLNAVPITPDGSVLAAIDGSSTTLYSVATGAVIATIAEGGNSLAISSDAATVLVGDPGFNSGAGRAVWYDSNVAPTITLQPVSLSVTVGSTATFTAAATGYSTVQWSFTGSSTRRRAALGGMISGATSPSFTTNPTSLAFSGNTYSATFTSAAGLSATTSAATLTVLTGSGGGSGGSGGSGGGSSGSASGDPHVMGFDGQKYELVGERHGVYNLVTDTSLQLNVRLGKVRATSHLDLPGLFMLEAGIKFDNHSVLVDAGSFDRQGTALLDGKPLRARWPDERASPTETLASIEWLDPPSVGDRFGLPHLEHIAGVVTIEIADQYRVEVFFAESGISSLSHQLVTPFPRRFLDVRVTMLKTDAAPHGILGQSAPRSLNKRRRHTLTRDTQDEFEIEGAIDDYRVHGDSLLGDSFAFNLFTNRSVAE